MLGVEIHFKVKYESIPDTYLDVNVAAIFDRSGRYVVTGSDDRLVKIWSMETAFCLASCRGHEVGLNILESKHLIIICLFYFCLSIFCFSFCT